MKSKTDNKERLAPAAGSPPCTSLEIANEVIRQQEYLLNRQQEIVRCAIIRNNEMCAASNEIQRELEAAKRENHKLRKELKGHKEGRLWTAITSFLPTMEMRFKDE